MTPHSITSGDYIDAVKKAAQKSFYVYQTTSLELVICRGFSCYCQDSIDPDIKDQPNVRSAQQVAAKRSLRFIQDTSFDYFEDYIDAAKKAANK